MQCMVALTALWVEQNRAFEVTATAPVTALQKNGRLQVGSGELAASFKNRVLEESFLQSRYQMVLNRRISILQFFFKRTGVILKY
jgi:hypothetical protein